jgi:MobA/MobL family
MAFYRLAVKHYSRGSITSIAGHARYLTREGRYGTEAHMAYLTRQERDGNGREDLVYAAHGTMPSWAEDEPARFWSAAEQHGRVNARLATEVLLGLPRELDTLSQIVAVRTFVHEHLRERHPYTLALHHTTARDGQPQPHAHVMYSPRTLDGIERSAAVFFQRAHPYHPERGGAKVDVSLYRQETLQRYREGWAQILNQALARAGRSERVDHRSNDARGMARVPEPKLHWRESRDLKQLLAREGYTGREHQLSAAQIAAWQGQGRITERMVDVLEARRVHQQRTRARDDGRTPSVERTERLAQRLPDHLRTPGSQARHSHSMLERLSRQARGEGSQPQRRRRMHLDRERDTEEREGWRRER